MGDVVGTEADLQAVIAAYGDEIRRCRYGSFRGVIKDGKIVIFAIEHEWRPQLDVAAPQVVEPDGLAAPAQEAAGPPAA